MNQSHDRRPQLGATCMALALASAAAFHVATPQVWKHNSAWLARPALRHPSTPSSAVPAGGALRKRTRARATGLDVAPSQRLHEQEEEEATAAGLSEILKPRGAARQRFVFFGGKGGVGKTSTSAAAAVECADKGLATLVISTDPAHSLGDALDQNVSGGRPVTIMGMENLWAMEVDAEAAITEFREAMEALDVANFAAELGIPQDIVQGLGLMEVGELLRNPPPGIDELVALAGVVRLAEDKGSEYSFDRIIIDTAPTGHTLRLLAFPEFLDSFLSKVIKLRSRLEGVLNLAQTFLGAGSGGKAGGATLAQKMDAAVAKLEEFRERMVRLRELFQDSDRTEFCVVAIPTTLATAESGRLLATLRSQDIAVRNVIVNQVVAAPVATAAAGSSEDAAAAAAAAGDAYLSRLRRGQEASLKRLKALGERPPPVALTTVPYFDVEVTGVYPLRYFGDVAFGGRNADNWAELMGTEAGGEDGRRFIILGGKGGVGKTSSAAALACRLADFGHDTVVVSTDPAHSLGDALQLDLSGGKLVSVPGGGGGAAPGTVGGSLYALEVDTEGAVAEFKRAVDAFARRSREAGGGSGGGGGGGLLGQLDLEGFAEVLDTAPPGTDELVALSKVLSLVRGDNELGKTFDRIVIDTAPTGHTLRMLSFPQFLDDFFERLIRVRNRFKGASALFGMFGGGGGGSKAAAGGGGDAVAEEEEDKDRLRDLQFKMMELQELFRDEAQSEFVVVTIPTELAAAESERLVASLREEGVPVKHMVVNKVVSEAQQKGYLDRLARGQAASLAEMARLARAAGAALTPVPYFDVEVRGIYGLRAIAGALFRPPPAGGS